MRKIMPPGIQPPATAAVLPFTFDDDGFLVDTPVWNENLAQTIADLDGIGTLQPEQWALIHYIRQHYFQYGTLPVMAHVCKTNHMPKTAIVDGFGSCRELWRIAGLPNPGEEARNYML